MNGDAASSPRRTSVVAVLVLAAFAAIAGCTSEQTTVQTDTAGTTPTSVAATTPPTTVATTTPPTTAAATTTTEAAPTPTTSAAPPAPTGPAAVNLAVLAGSGSGGWLHLGGWQRTDWQRAGASEGIDIEPGTTLTVSSLTGERGGTAGAAAESCFDDRVGPTVTPEIAAPEPPGFGYGAVAVVPPAWPLKPRPVTTTTATVAAYEALGEAAFAGEPVDPTVGDVTQLVLSDLDGDGDDEALAVFESVAAQGASASPGDLAALLLIDTETRTASTVVRSLVASDAQGGFFVIDRYRVLDVLDLNGDGRMEVVVHAWYFEGAATLVYEYDGTSLTEVLADGCGT